MNRLSCPRSGLLLKEGVDREVKAGQNFKHPLAHGPPDDYSSFVNVGRAEPGVRETFRGDIRA